jgi:hypothetical protein
MTRLPLCCVLVAVSSVFVATGVSALGQKTEQTPTQVYLAYRAVLAKATSVDDLKPWHSKAVRAKMDATPKDESAMMLKLVKMLSEVTNLKVVKEEKTSTGITLFVEAVDLDKTKKTGEVFLIREDGAWKLERERWKS